MTPDWTSFVTLARRVHGVNTSSDEANDTTSVRWNGRAVCWDKTTHRAYLVVGEERKWVGSWTNTMYRALFAMGEY